MIILKYANNITDKMLVSTIKFENSKDQHKDLLMVVYVGVDKPFKVI